VPSATTRSALALLLFLLFTFFGSFLSLAIKLDSALGGSQGHRHRSVVFVLDGSEGLGASHGEERLHTIAAGSARFVVVIATVLSAPGSSSLCSDYTLTVRLVAADNEREKVLVRGLGQVEEVLFPEGESVEALLVADIEGQDAAVGATVKGEADGDVLLLAGSVPDLHGEVRVLHLELLLLEISADRGACVARVASAELVNQGGLANIDIAEEDDLGDGLLHGIRLSHCAQSINLFTRLL